MIRLTSDLDVLYREACASPYYRDMPEAERRAKYANTDCAACLLRSTCVRIGGKEAQWARTVLERVLHAMQTHGYAPAATGPVDVNVVICISPRIERGAAFTVHTTIVLRPQHRPLVHEFVHVLQKRFPEFYLLKYLGQPGWRRLAGWPIEAYRRRFGAIRNPDELDVPLVYAMDGVEVLPLTHPDQGTFHVRVSAPSEARVVPTTRVLFLGEWVAGMEPNEMLAYMVAKRWQVEWPTL